MIFQGSIQKLKRKLKFKRQFNLFESTGSSTSTRFTLVEKSFIPGENTPTTDFDRHYIYHTAWAARILKNNMPEKHIDIASLLYFSTLVSAFLPIEFYD